MSYAIKNDTVGKIRFCLFGGIAHVKLGCFISPILRWLLKKARAFKNSIYRALLIKPLLASFHKIPKIIKSIEIFEKR